MNKIVLGLALLLLTASAQAQPIPGQGGSFASQPIGGITGGATPTHVLSTASTNSTSIKATPGNVYEVVAINTTATIYYLKFYDTAGAPTCNTATVVLTFPVPFGTSSSGGGYVIPVPVGASFKNGIGICLTAGIADNDNTNAATGVAINILYN